MKTIIEMAREAGLEFARFTIIDGSNKLITFAALVRADEREVLAQPEQQCQYPKCSYPCPDLPDCRDAEQPPRRTWAKLTNDEIKDLWIEYRASLPRYLCFANAFEAKLKEKNT